MVEKQDLLLKCLLADETTNTPTAFNDKLVGSDDLDTFTALAGDDEIYGFGGNDQIIAGTGNDTIYGGDGDDNIQPGAGDDKIYGEGGNDTIYLSAGADIEDGGEGYRYNYIWTRSNYSTCYNKFRYRSIPFHKSNCISNTKPYSV